MLLSDIQKLLKKHEVDGFSYNSDIDEQETHGSTALIGHPQAFRRLHLSLQCPNEIITQGLPAIEQFFKLQSEKYGYQIKPSSSAINQAGYIALDKKDVINAIKIFEANVKHYPYKADVYDSLADGYEANGQFKLALKMRSITMKKSMIENVENNAYKTRQANLLDLIKENNSKSDEVVIEEKGTSNVGQ